MFLCLSKVLNVSRRRIMKVFLKSFGCSTNVADGEVLSGCLVAAGHDLVDSIASANIIIYNTCAVKGPTEDRIINLLKNVPEEKKIVVSGCLPLINFERLCKEVRFDGVLGPAAGTAIVQAVKQVGRGEKVNALTESLTVKPRLTLPRVRSNTEISIIQINYGCLGSCAYCCVVLARGRLRSYSIQEIVKKIKEDLAIGIHEFWLTSQDTGCYGRDRNTNLAELLHGICKIKEDFRVRVGMMNPNLVLDLLDDLIPAFQHEQVFKFIHLPVQSGDNQTLKSMHRLYSVEDFKHIVNVFRTAFPAVTLATDIICGFPNEREEAFNKTLKLIEETEPDIVNISRFFARPGTEAAEMRGDFVPIQKIKQRSATLANRVKKIAFRKNQRWIGWEGEILIDEDGKNIGTFIGRNFAYKPTVVKSADNLVGKTIKVRIINAFPTYLEGKIIG